MRDDERDLDDLAAATAALQAAVDTLRTLRREWAAGRSARDAAAAQARLDEAEARVRQARARLEAALERRRASDRPDD